MQTTLSEDARFQRTLNGLLRLSLEDVGLDELLVRALDRLLEAPFLRFEPKGCIYLTEGEPPELVLKASRGAPPLVRSVCGRLAFGRCY
jgi:hypothetical protein